MGGALNARGLRIALIAATAFIAWPPIPATAMPFEVVVKSRSALGWPPQVIQVVQTPDEWATAWRSIGYLGTPPQVDFRKRMLVIYRMGPQQGTGSKTTVEGLEVYAGVMRLKIRETLGRLDCGGGTVLEAPAVVISTVRWPGPIEVDRQTDANTCGR